MKFPITVLIHTLNEERNIRNCLECVKWADDIVVIDMYSNDKTVEIAKEYTSRVYFYERIGYVEPARQFALEQAKHEWVLIVDADELVPITLRDRLIEIMKCDQYDAVLIPHRNFFFGHAMAGTGWGPLQDMHIRFFRKGYMSFSKKIHGGIKLDNKAQIYRIGDEECSFIHFNYVDVEQFLEKLNRYTSIEAQNTWEERKPLNKFRVIRHIVREITKRFIKQKGYKDGFQGFLLACLMAGYQASSAMKKHLMDKYQTQDVKTQVLQNYQNIAHLEIGKYENKH